jgi:hypothetical protein
MDHVLPRVHEELLFKGHVLIGTTYYYFRVKGTLVRILIHLESIYSPERGSLSQSEPRKENSNDGEQSGFRQWLPKSRTRVATPIKDHKIGRY